MEEKPKVLVIGAGAIGLSLAGWIFPYNSNLHLLARGESLSAIKDQGLQLYQIGQKTKSKPLSVKAIESLSQIPPPDIIIITVKNYDLEQIAKMLKNQLASNSPVIATFQNGIENQKILPKYFSKIVYGVVCYNAWREGPGQVAFVKKGYVIIGTPTNELQPELKSVKNILEPGIECSITDCLWDAVHCKLGNQPHKCINGASRLSKTIN